MRLYLIKRKSDGMFLAKVEAHYSAHVGQDKNSWSSKNYYLLRSPDGVAMNLRKLCSEPYFVSAEGIFGRELRWRDFDAGKLKLFEVVVMDVDVISMTATPAEHFAQLEAIESIPLTRAERSAA